MKTEIIARYETRGGLTAFEVFKTVYKSGKVSYRYNGKHGAGCGQLKDIANSIKTTIASRRGIKLVYGTDITD